MEWKQILEAVDEEYLVGISNKGIVKRACKDKEESAETPVIDFAGSTDALEVAAGEETVKIVFPLGESKCSCPSRSICRHVVMAILCAKEQAAEGQVLTEGQPLPEGQPPTARQSLPEGQPLPENDKKNTSAEALAETEETERSDVAASTSEEVVRKEGEQISSQTNESLWGEILAYPHKKLFRVLGTKGLSALVAGMEKQNVHQIQETSIITVKLSGERNVVKLLSPLEYSACTCHKKELCAHKAEAILWCQWQKGKISVDVLKNQLEQAPEYDREQLQEATGQIKAYLEELLQMGLCRSSIEVVNALERLAILAHKGELPKIESSLRSLAESYNKYIKRSAAFSVKDTQRHLMNLYKAVCQLANAESNSEISALAGEFRAEYKLVGSLDLMGITMEHFISQSGYEGDTVYFLEETTGKWYTYTNARPTFYDNKRKNAYTAKAMAPWGLSTVSLGDLANLRIHLRNAKADETGRLSSTQESQAEVVGVRKLTEEVLEKWHYRDFGEVFKEQVEVAYEEEAEGLRRSQKLVFLQPARREDAVFDQIEQILRMPLYDEAGRKVIVEVAYSKKEKDTINYLERLKDKAAACFLGRIYLKGSTLRLYPIDLFGEKDLPWAKEEKKLWSLFGKKEKDALEEEEAADTSVQNSISVLFGEIEESLDDLYQVGFATVQESILQRMQQLSERAMDYGMQGLTGSLQSLVNRLANQRHQLTQSEEIQGRIFEEYLQLCEYISKGQKKVMYDKASLCYDKR